MGAWDKSVLDRHLILKITAYHPEGQEKMREERDVIIFQAIVAL
jgi:hypothetical protein